MRPSVQRLSALFGRTLREDPADATIASHRLMVRGAFIRPLGAGIFSYLPLGWRTLRRIEQVVREEMDAVGCQELLMPVVHPSTLWERTGRFASLGPELVRFKDRADRNMVLALTHEEIALDLAARVVGSYRQLPVSVYHFQTKFRDEPRPRGGLLRTREFTMKDAYTFDPSPESLDATYRQFVTAYVRAFRRCGIEPLVVESDAGAMGGSDADEFHALTSAGEDTIVVCPKGDYGANQEVATTRPPDPDDAEPLPMEKVETPGQETIAAVAGYLGIPTRRTLKAVFYWTGDQIAFVAIRGDLDVNEAKLRRALGAPDIRLAADQELTAAGLVPGYASPVGLEEVLVVVDRSVESAANLVAGANMPGVHLMNVNFPRDFAADLVADIAAVAAGDPCPKCGAALELRTGIEIGNTFKFGAYYSGKLDANFLSEGGSPQPIVMGSYGIGITRLAAAVVELHHDEHGIIWPASVAPYDVHVVQLGQADEVQEGADRLAHDLEAAGLAVLVDDRDESAGVKFNDADLLGIPIRCTVSRRTVRADAVEIKLRHQDEREQVASAEAVARVVAEHDALLAALTPDAPIG